PHQAQHVRRRFCKSHWLLIGLLSAQLALTAAAAEAKRPRHLVFDFLAGLTATPRGANSVQNRGGRLDPQRGPRGSLRTTPRDWGASSHERPQNPPIFEPSPPL